MGNVATNGGGNGGSYVFPTNGGSAPVSIPLSQLLSSIGQNGNGHQQQQPVQVQAFRVPLSQIGAQPYGGFAQQQLGGSQQVQQQPQPFSVGLGLLQFHHFTLDFDPVPTVQQQPCGIGGVGIPQQSLGLPLGLSGYQGQPFGGAMNGGGSPCGGSFVIKML